MENTLSHGDTQGAANARLMLIGVSSLVLLVLIATLIARLTGYSTGTPPVSPVTEMRELGFRDMPRGVVDIYDWQSEAVIARLSAGEGSFIRGVVRSLVRQRRGLPRDLSTPFVLAAHADGRLVLSDRATGESIDLVAFGPTNMASFRPLLYGTVTSDKPASAEKAAQENSW